MKYCTICLQPDTRPNTYFDASGECPACLYSNELRHVDWEERFEILQELIRKYARKTAKQKFDCIIGVSGGKDSTRQALWIRDKLGLNPLLVCLAYPPEHVTQRGMDNLSNLIELGFNIHVSALAPATWRSLMRHAFNKFTNFACSTELALFASVPRIAIRYQIPLILWGENPGLQLGDMKTLGKTGYDGNNLRNMNTLRGGSLDWMLEAGIAMDSLIPYQYPSRKEFDAVGLQIVYLGWFLKDWSWSDNALYSCASGLSIRTDSPELTGDLEGVTSLDEDWVTLNQMIKYYKYGFGRATDYVNDGIRSGQLTREEGIELVQQYDGKCGDGYIASFCDYIDISVQDFWSKVHQSVNSELFDISNNVIKPKFKVGVGL